MATTLDFRRLTPDDKVLIDTHNTSLAPYADWAYGTMVAWWDFFDDLEITFHNDNLLVRSSYLSDGEKPFITLIGDHAVQDTIDDIFAWQRERGDEQLIASSPLYIVDGLDDPSRYSIIEDLDNAEYVISAEAHASLINPEHKRIRQKIHAFEREPFYENLTVIDYPLDSAESKLRLINALHMWDTRHANRRDTSEGLVIDKVLRHAEEIDLHCLCVMINDRVEAFVLYKYLTPTTINLNHLKVNYAYKDIFHYTMHAVARHLVQKGVTHMNIEQDLGIEGLRTYKQRLRPSHMMRKFSIRPQREQ